MQSVRVTGVEGGDLAGVVGLPEELPLIQGILRSAPLLDVGVLRV